MRGCSALEPRVPVNTRAGGTLISGVVHCPTRGVKHAPRGTAAKVKCAFADGLEQTMLRFPQLARA
jgi:hypothetical protein